MSDSSANPPSSDVPRVCAVVLTSNRLEMLTTCLDRLDAQSRRPDHVLVIDNGSADGTAEHLAGRRGIEALRLEENIGGAGGYAYGLKQALDRGFDYMWMLDDDAFAEHDALEALLAGIERAPRRPDLVTSVVRWRDSRLHPMNQPWLRLNRRAEFAEAAGSGLALIRAATSVSTMVSSEALRRHGFPPAHFIVWIDDIEWTGRILREGTGYMVPESVTYHWTPNPHDSVIDARDRFYYKARNHLWVLRAGRSFGGRERIGYGIAYASAISRYLRQSSDRRAALRTVVRGMRAGLKKEPR